MKGRAGRRSWTTSLPEYLMNRWCSALTTPGLERYSAKTRILSREAAVGFRQSIPLLARTHGHRAGTFRISFYRRSDAPISSEARAEYSGQSDLEPCTYGISWFDSCYVGRCCVGVV